MEESRFHVPFLQTEVVLTVERKQHILSRHSDLGTIPEIERRIAATLAGPSVIQRSRRDEDGLVFVRWHSDLHRGKFLLVMVIRDSERKWIITAYSSHVVPKGEVLWAED